MSRAARPDDCFARAATVAPAPKICAWVMIVIGLASEGVPPFSQYNTVQYTFDPLTAEFIRHLHVILEKNSSSRQLKKQPADCV